MVVGKQLERSLVLTNTSAKSVAFKVKTTAPKRYCVRPNSSVIKPQESIEVRILMQPLKELPPADTPIVLVCSHGPKSLVALDYLSEACPRAVCVEGGISAWDSAVLPVEDV